MQIKSLQGFATLNEPSDPVLAVFKPCAIKLPISFPEYIC